MSSYYSRGPTGYNRDRYANNYTTGSRPSGLPSDRDIEEGLGPTSLETLSKPQRVADATLHRVIQPARLKYIGSYNWVERATPTIIVPGAPPMWRDRALPFRVAFDSGMRMVDQNGFRIGSDSSLLPLFRAVDVVSEEKGSAASVDWPSVDIVTDRNGLRKLLRWIGHSAGEEPPKEFRIDLQLGGRKTVLMQRWEKRTREVATPPKSGYGHNFEHESTSPARGCEASTGHHRIVQYELDGLKLVVRCEVDACTAQPVPIQRSTTAPRNTAASVDDLADAISGLNVSSTVPSTRSSGVSTITVIRAGGEVPQSSIVELKTRSQNYVHQFDWIEQYPQLFLSYTPNLFLAVHNRGTFERIKKHTLGSAELRSVEQDPQIQRSFRQLIAILRTIQELVKSRGLQGRLTLLCQDGVLRVYERTSSAGSLPTHVLTRFDV
ncbi:hypothetical protein C2E23DRAFT_326109 [Lenzites betulinus]|nr:hypothetical protein C2E23DRAFT_326109 [Lenzites betulinus]